MIAYESEALVRTDGWSIASPLEEYPLTPSIHGIFSCRIDYLKKDMKRILQEASVIGRTFFYEVLKEVTCAKDRLDDNLAALERLDLIRMKTAHPRLEYSFKHALIRETAYASLLTKDRQEMHERIGRILERISQERLPELYETLAFHFVQRGYYEKARLGMPVRREES